MRKILILICLLVASFATTETLPKCDPTKTPTPQYKTPTRTATPARTFTATPTFTVTPTRTAIPPSPTPTPYRPTTCADRNATCFSSADGSCPEGYSGVGRADSCAGSCCVPKPTPTPGPDCGSVCIPEFIHVGGVYLMPEVSQFPLEIEKILLSGWLYVKETEGNNPLYLYWVNLTEVTKVIPVG